MTGTERGTLLEQICGRLMVDRYDIERVRREIASGFATVDGVTQTEPGLIIHAGQRIAVPFRTFMRRCAVDVGPNGKAWIAGTSPQREAAGQ